MIPWAKTKRTLDSRAPLWTSVTCAGIKTEYQEAIALLDSLPKRRAEFIDPMDCAPVSGLPDGSQWFVEIKLHGYRAVAQVNQFERLNRYRLVHALAYQAYCSGRAYMENVVEIS